LSRPKINKTKIILENSKEKSNQSKAYWQMPSNTTKVYSRNAANVKWKVLEKGSPMKIGLLMAGISYGYKSDRDFRHCYPNIAINLIEPLKSRHSVEIYVTTYEHEHMSILKELYEPVNIKILPYQGNTQLTTRKECFMLADHGQLDFYIMTRFDLHYNVNFENHNMDYSKFNIISREGNGFWERNGFVGDVFFAWPRSMHHEVRKAFDFLTDMARLNDWRYDGNHNHSFYNAIVPLVGHEKIHFMFNTFQLSGHEFASICTDDCSRRLRGQYFVNPEVLARFP
jgi:hypothetical protein